MSNQRVAAYTTLVHYVIRWQHVCAPRPPFLALLHHVILREQAMDMPQASCQGSVRASLSAYPPARAALSRACLSES